MFSLPTALYEVKACLVFRLVFVSFPCESLLQTQVHLSPLERRDRGGLRSLDHLSERLGEKFFAPTTCL